MMNQIPTTTEQPTAAERLADMIDTIERQGDATVRLAPDMRRLLVQASILARRLAIDSRDRHAASRPATT